MSLTVLQGAVEQGFIYSLVALGLYLSYRTLDVADLTTDGSFTLGAACSAILTIGGHPVQGLLLALAAGALAGFVTALLQTRLGVQPILAGIVTMTGLYSVNLMVMGGRSNLNMLKEANVFTAAEGLLGPAGKLVLAGILALLVGAGLALFLRTQLGLSIRATGDNREMVAASSIDPAFTTTVGLCAANAMVALSGGLLVQYQKFSDISLGTGMVVIGLASLIIGEVVMGRRSVVRGVAAALVGAVIYRIIIATALVSTKVGAQNFKLVSAVIVAAAISWPAIREELRFYQLRREVERNG
ncbi:MAG: ABC transporter permease [Angelakisella sp.]|jgi:putative ABC transport system permease protein|nr:ABC transporter permease [Angelakisella sp.]